MRPKLTYANVMATMAVFIALGGSAYAATQLKKNSVGTKQLKKNAVVAAKIKNGAVTAAKLADGSVTTGKLGASAISTDKIADGSVTNAKLANGAVNGAKVADGSLTGKQVNASTLGTVPAAERANSLPPAEPWHVVGAVGEPVFLNGWKDAEPESVWDALAFYKDHEGLVHLKGRALGGTGTHMFNLPPGFRPPEKKTIFPVVACEGLSVPVCVLNIGGTTPTEPTNSGSVYVPIGATSIAFDGVTFRAES